MICLRCDGKGFVDTVIHVPARVYGEPRTLPATAVCPCCKGRKTIEPRYDGKALAAGED